MKIAHVTDLHVSEGPALADQASDLSTLLSQVLAAVPDLILITGDLYGRTVPHRPSPRERSILEPAIVRLAEVAPVVIVEGNHDHGESLALAAQLGGNYPIRVVSGAEAFTVHTPSGPVQVYGLAYPTKRWILADSAAVGLGDARDATTAAVVGILRTWGARIDRARKRPNRIPIVVAAHVTIKGSTIAGGEVLASQEIEIPQEVLAGLAVDYGALGHIHRRQEIAPRWWYAGSPWPIDFGERGPRGWNLVTLDGERIDVDFQDVEARPWRTLDYRWASDRENGNPRWISQPTRQELVDVAGAVVRARLVVPDYAVAGCPWEAELANLEDLGAHRVHSERVIEPTMRIRAPQVAAAVDLAGKVRGYWSTLATPPEGQNMSAALGALQELETLDDTAIKALSDKVIG